MTKISEQTANDRKNFSTKWMDAFGRQVWEIMCDYVKVNAIVYHPLEYFAQFVLPMTSKTLKSRLANWKTWTMDELRLIRGVLDREDQRMKFDGLIVVFLSGQQK